MEEIIKYLEMQIDRHEKLKSINWKNYSGIQLSGDEAQKILSYIKQRESLTCTDCPEFKNVGRKQYPPSMFSKFPMGSVLQKTECEVVAQNIMIILKQSGDKFRELTWEEYRERRLKDGRFNDGEKYYFNQVVGFCISSDTAQTFSEQWKINQFSPKERR